MPVSLRDMPLNTNENRCRTRKKRLLWSQPLSIGIKAFLLTVWFCVQSTSVRADDEANQLDILLRCDLNISIQKSSGVENLRKSAIFNARETPTGVGSNWRDKKPGVRIVPQDILLFDLVVNSTFDINRITGTGSTEFSDMSTDTRWHIINYKYHVNRKRYADPLCGKA
jgi:hypothetical protein